MVQAMALHRQPTVMPTRTAPVAGPQAPRSFPPPRTMDVDTDGQERFYARVKQAQSQRRMNGAPPPLPPETLPWTQLWGLLTAVGVLPRMGGGGISRVSRLGRPPRGFG